MSERIEVNDLVTIKSLITDEVPKTVGTVIRETTGARWNTDFHKFETARLLEVLPKFASKSIMKFENELVKFLK